MVSEERRLQMREYWRKNKSNYNKIRREEYKKDPEPRKIKSNIFRKNNKEYYRKYHLEYWKKNRGRFLHINKLRSRDWYSLTDKKKYRNKKRIWENNKKKIDIQFAIKKRLRLRVWQAINDIRKEMYDDEFHLNYKPIVNKLLSILPKDFDKKEYQIDHIIPLHKFDLTKQEELIKAFSPDNHQWLNLEEHRIKTAKELSDINKIN